MGWLGGGRVLEVGDMERKRSVKEERDVGVVEGWKVGWRRVLR